MLTQFAANALQRTADFLALGEYSEATKRSYLAELRYLFTYYVTTRPSQLNEKMAVDYLIYRKRPTNYTLYPGSRVSSSDSLVSGMRSSVLFSHSYGLISWALHEPKKLYIIAIRCAAVCDPAKR